MKSTITVRADFFHLDSQLFEIKFSIKIYYCRTLSKETIKINLIDTQSFLTPIMLIPYNK